MREDKVSFEKSLTYPGNIECAKNTFDFMVLDFLIPVLFLISELNRFSSLSGAFAFPVLSRTEQTWIKSDNITTLLFN